MFLGNTLHLPACSPFSISFLPFGLHALVTEVHPSNFFCQHWSFVNSIIIYHFSIFSNHGLTTGWQFSFSGLKIVLHFILAFVFAA
jgi:hypothetical protein